MKTNLKALRVRRKLTQKEMADMLGEKVATYGTWERGTTVFNVEQLMACAVILECSCDEILCHEVATTFSDPREAELHRIWSELDFERQERLLSNAQDMEYAKRLRSDALQARAN